MLAEAADAPFRRDGWLFELKYDGYRLLAGKAGGTAALRLRGGGEASSAFPEVARAVAALPAEDALLDGELVVLDEAGRPDFQALQARAQLRRPADVAAASVTRPATLFAFDLLAVAGLDLRPLPLSERKAILAALVPRLGALRFADHLETEGEALFREATARGLEGVVAKRAASPYRAGRSADWRKVRAARTADLAVVGFTAPARGRSGFGALHLAVPRGGRPGLRRSRRQRLRRGGAGGALGPALRPRAPAAGLRRRHAAGRGHRWVEPELVGGGALQGLDAPGAPAPAGLPAAADDKRLAEADRRAAPAARGAARRRGAERPGRSRRRSRSPTAPRSSSPGTASPRVTWSTTTGPSHRPCSPILRDRPVV